MSTKKLQNAVSMKELFYVSLFCFSLFFSESASAIEEPSLHYTFASESVVNDTVIKDQSPNGYDGIIHNEAIVEYDATLDINVLNLGNFNGYLDLQAKTGELIGSLTDFTISTYMYIGSNASLGSNGNMLWAFANSDDMGTDANGYLFWHARNSNRYAITASSWSSEQSASTGVKSIDAGLDMWHHVAITQKGDLATVYLDGIEKSTSTIGLKPSDLGATTHNYIGKPCYKSDVFLLDSKVADFRIYSNALSASDIMTLAGPTAPDDYPANLLSEKEDLDLGDLTNVSTKISLPLTGTNDTEILITWTSSNNSIIDTLGNITQPELLDGTVILTATLSKNGYSLKKSFTATVPASSGFEEPRILQWLFDDEWVDEGVVTDAAELHLEGAMVDGAKVRKIGTPETNEFNTLDLGENNGYFDMGTEVGKLIYGLSNFTISTYFRVDESYTQLGRNGNFIWCFSNSDDTPRDRNGNMIARLLDYRLSITPTIYGSDQQAVDPGNEAATTGTWHHYAYTQDGNQGTIYVDGEVIASGSITNLPSTSLVKEDRTGTLFNWIGKSCYPGDVFLQNTLIYDFSIFNIGASADDVFYSIFNEGITLTELNEAYEANPDPNYPQELITAKTNLDLGDISALTTDISLPELLDGDVVVEWSTSNAFVIDVFGTVIRPEDLNGTVILTATLSKNGYSVTKDFTATVLATGGFSSSLLLNYNFKSDWVDGNSVQDAAEKHFTGTMMGGAGIRAIGSGDTQFDVLDLKTDSAYFDMGEDCGKLIYGLTDYSTSIYFLIETSKTNLNDNGNFIYSFANSDSSEIDKNGYIFSRATFASHTISTHYWQQGNQSLSKGDNPTSGVWHHLSYTQNGTIGTVYYDGDTVASGEISNIPSIALAQEGRSGTLFNWLGRSSYSSDAYFSQSLLHDFRLYNVALTPEEISDLNLSVANLNKAYSPSLPIQEVDMNMPFRINTNIPGLIQINGLLGNENIAVYEISGRKLSVLNTQSIPARAGIYIVRINNFAKKVLVK